MVERFQNSKVIARITPVGLLKTTISEHQVTAFAISQGLKTSGTWETKKSRLHKSIDAVENEGYRFE